MHDLIQKDDMQTAQTAEPMAEEVPELDSLDGTEAEAAALSEAASTAALVEVDLDDQTSTMGDSVHTYL